MNKVTTFALLLLLAGCVAKVKTFSKTNQDFSQYTTWCWLKGCELTYQGPEEYYDAQTFEAIGNAIATNMFNKGYEQKDESSDLLVNYFIVLREDSTSVSDDYETMITSTFEPQYERFLKGSLIIDVIDRERSELIWRSTAVRYMEINPEYDEKLVTVAVKKAMKDFPEKSR